MTIISAPGKVLITGGYLILDPKCSGLVLTTTSRFYTVIDESDARSTDITISVTSPQLHWSAQYHFIVTQDGYKMKTNGKENPYVENSLFYSLCVAHLHNKAPNKNLKIQVLADNDFYSQTENVSF